MDIFEILLSWLQERNILPQVDRCGVRPGEIGLFPLGVEELQRRQDILGGAVRRARYGFLLRATAVPGEASARALLNLQELAAEDPPVLGENQRFRAEKGKLLKDTGSGTGLYEIRLIAEREETL